MQAFWSSSDLQMSTHSFGLQKKTVLLFQTFGPAFSTTKVPGAIVRILISFPFVVRKFQYWHLPLK